MDEYLKIKYILEMKPRINRQNKKPIRIPSCISTNKTIKIKYCSYRNNNFSKIVAIN